MATHTSDLGTALAKTSACPAMPRHDGYSGLLPFYGRDTIRGANAIAGVRITLSSRMRLERKHGSHMRHAGFYMRHLWPWLPVNGKGAAIGDMEIIMQLGLCLNCILSLWLLSEISIHGLSGLDKSGVRTPGTTKKSFWATRIWGLVAQWTTKFSQLFFLKYF